MAHFVENYFHSLKSLPAASLLIGTKNNVNKRKVAASHILYVNSNRTKSERFRQPNVFFASF